MHCNYNACKQRGNFVPLLIVFLSSRITMALVKREIAEIYYSLYFLTSLICRTRWRKPPCLLSSIFRRKYCNWYFYFQFSKNLHVLRFRDYKKTCFNKMLIFPCVCVCVRVSLLYYRKVHADVHRTELRFMCIFLAEKSMSSTNFEIFRRKVAQ